MIRTSLYLCLACTFVIVSLLFVLLILVDHKQREKKESMSNDLVTFPKTIWTYWNTDNLPEDIQICFDSWKTHNPDYTLHILTSANLSAHVPELAQQLPYFKHNDSHARASDFIRLHVLSRYGGFWLDASILCTSSLRWIQRRSVGKEFFGFYLPNFTTDDRYPVIESWCFACTRGSAFVTSWRDEFMRLNEYETVADYVRAVSSDTDLQNLATPEYLTIHASAQRVLQKQGAATLELVSATDRTLGPFLYLNVNQWDSEKAIAQLKSQKHLRTPLIKLRGQERALLQGSDLSSW